MNSLDHTPSLPTQVIGHPCIILEETDSTNAELARRLQHQAHNTLEGITIIAKRQQQGRGRLGRVWHSDSQHQLCMSILLTPSVEENRLPQLSLVTAVAIWQALADIAPLSIKWPNDILIQGKKLAGILSERRSSYGAQQQIIMGIGMNIHMPDQGFPEDISDIATALNAHIQQPISRIQVAMRILSSLETYYNEWLAYGFESIRQQWWAAHAASQQPVRAHDGNRGYIEGIAMDLDSDGALLLHTNTGMQRIIAGEVHIL